MDSGGPFYIHITYKFYSGELWVVYMSHIYYKHLPWTVVVHFTYTSPTYSTVVSSGWSIGLTFITNTYHGQWWSICLTFITNTYHGQWWSILRTHLLHILQWWALGGIYVSHLLQTLTMDNGGPFYGGPFYVHISYIFLQWWALSGRHICLTFITNTYHGQWWSILRTHLLQILQCGGIYVSQQTLTMVVHISYIFYMSHIYYIHLPWTMVVHFAYTSPTYSTVVSSRWFICLTFITNTYHGQWWSILCTHLLQLLAVSCGWYICLTFITNTYHVVSSRWSICLTFITNTFHGQWWSILHTHHLQILQWWALGGIYVSHLLQTLTMDSGGPFYVHISYIFYSGELWVVYRSHIYNKHLPWTVVVHFKYTSPTYSTVVSSRWSICLTFITNTFHGQWWSILHTHLLHILQWWALGGIYVSHL